MLSGCPRSTSTVFRAYSGRDSRLGYRVAAQFLAMRLIAPPGQGFVFCAQFPYQVAGGDCQRLALFKKLFPDVDAEVVDGLALMWPAQVSQASLTTMTRPVDTVNAVQKAFGPQYAAELKRQAGAKPDAKLRRKHQIGSLYHDAKVRELDLFVRRVFLRPQALNAFVRGRGHRERCSGS